MSVKCLECGKILASSVATHLRVHGMNKKSYLEKYPNAEMIDEDFRKRASEKKIKDYMENPELKMRVSEGTKKGMRKPESWKKYRDHISNRDYTGEKNPFYGKTHSEEKKKIMYTKERAKKISDKRLAWWANNRGKSVEELYGKETGERIRKVRSEQNAGNRNPAYGKVYDNAGSCKLGKYKGQFFRGILEYSYLKYLDNENKSFQYEPFSIPYILNGVDRTYHPDFLVENELIEIKPKFKLDLIAEEISAKKEAAEEYCKKNGLIYEILTEDDFPVITYSRAYADPDVEWIRK